MLATPELTGQLMGKKNIEADNYLPASIWPYIVRNRLFAEL